MQQRRRVQTQQSILETSINHAARLVESEHPGQVLRLIQIERRKLAQLRSAQFDGHKTRRGKGKGTSRRIRAAETRLHGYLIVNKNFVDRVDLRQIYPREKFTI